MRLLPVLSLFFTAVYTRDTDQQAQVVLYTAGVSCKPCELVNKQFGYLASSAVQFRRIDYSIETKDQFKRAGIEGIPEIKLLLPGQDVDSWSLTRNGNLKSLAESLNSKGFKTQYNEPVDYARLAQTALSVVAGLLLIRSVGPHLWKALAQRTIWRSLSLLFISVMTSGYMWYSVTNQKGNYPHSALHWPTRRETSVYH